MKAGFQTLSYLAGALLSATAAYAEPPKAAVFDFQLANLGIQGPTEADRARLRPLSDLLRTLLKDSGRYTIVSTDPVKEEVTKGSDLRHCNGCAEEYAKKLGADVAITGEIQKVSNLILNINVYVKDLKSDKPEQAYSVDIRGDNDVSFDRGIKYLVKNNLPQSEVSTSIAPDTHDMIAISNAANIKWQPAPNDLPKGIEISLLDGDPAKSGPFVLRLTIPANTTIAPHTHSTAETVTILSGSLVHDMGSTIDKGRGKILGTGGFVSLPAHMAHSLWSTEEPVVIQVSGTGPFGLNYTNPADDPSKASGAGR